MHAITTVKATLEILAGFVLWVILMMFVIMFLILVAIVSILGRMIMLLIHRPIMAIKHHRQTA